MQKNNRHYRKERREYKIYTTKIMLLKSTTSEVSNDIYFVLYILCYVGWIGDLEIRVWPINRDGGWAGWLNSPHRSEYGIHFIERVKTLEGVTSGTSLLKWDVYLEKFWLHRVINVKTSIWWVYTCGCWSFHASGVQPPLAPPPVSAYDHYCLLTLHTLPRALPIPVQLPIDGAMCK
jgi:hypothetical protein